MIEYEMLKYVTIGGLKIGFWFTTHYLIAWPFAAYYIIKETLRKRNFDKGLDLNRMLQMFLLAFVGSFVGSRIFAFYGPWGGSCASGGFVERFMQMISLEQKGWVAIGGIIGGIVFTFVYSKITKLKYMRYADILAPAIALGFFIARLGCYIAGCCFGSQTDVPWAIIKDNVPIHPTQLYNSLVDLAIFVVLVCLSERKEKKNRQDGYVLSSFVFMYAVGRFTTEFFRGDYDPSNYFFGLTTTQIICIVFFLISATLIIINSLKESPKKRVKTGFRIRPKTYALLVSGGIIANIGAYIITPLPYLALIVIPSGLGIFFFGLTTIFSKPKN
ncbi:hypothetical protein COV19_07170 [Candidatus Woesearchaeota archaeon CG10_big_fil_rev_8_21_14_0_10_44_13]|nr:MAG: hypothetical protein COV19_07170 [Candidatus Woesearchaeota archaeon CG10_big_fil_rev_8_21_14_0_10_44_13]